MHCMGVMESVSIQIQLILGLATSWLSIAKNLFVFEENNYVRGGEELTLMKQLFLFFKAGSLKFFYITNFQHAVGSATRILTITIFWHGLVWRFWGSKSLDFFIGCSILPILLHFIILGLVKFSFEKYNTNINWKKLMKWSFLGVLGNFSDACKRLSVSFFGK